MGDCSLILALTLFHLKHSRAPILCSHLECFNAYFVFIAVWYESIITAFIPFRMLQSFSLVQPWWKHYQKWLCHATTMRRMERFNSSPTKYWMRYEILLVLYDKNSSDIEFIDKTFHGKRVSSIIQIFVTFVRFLY